MLTGLTRGRPLSLGTAWALDSEPFHTPMIRLTERTGAPDPPKHLPLGNAGNSCCQLGKHLAGLALGPVVTMMRLEWNLWGPHSGQTIIKVNFQIEATLNYS